MDEKETDLKILRRVAKYLEMTEVDYPHVCIAIKCEAAAIGLAYEGPVSQRLCSEVEEFIYPYSTMEGYMKATYNITARHKVLKMRQELIQRMIEKREGHHGQA